MRRSRETNKVTPSTDFARNSLPVGWAAKTLETPGPASRAQFISALRLAYREAKFLRLFASAMFRLLWPFSVSQTNGNSDIFQNAVCVCLNCSYEKSQHKKLVTFATPHEQYAARVTFLRLRLRDVATWPRWTQLRRFRLHTSGRSTIAFCLLQTYGSRTRLRPVFFTALCITSPRFSCSTDNRTPGLKLGCRATFWAGRYDLHLRYDALFLFK